MKINDVAKLTGVTVRTLHYYDEIGLLKPGKISEAGYRLYNEDDLSILQQILFFRELDFPLNEIKEIIASPSFDKEGALKNQKKLLIKKRDRLNKLINLVDNTIKGEDIMSFKEFDMTEIEKCKNEYADEVKERYGKSKEYEEYEKKTKGYGKEQWQMVDKEFSEMFKAFAANMNEAPESSKVQKLVKEWQDFISARFYNCTNEVLKGLGIMYVNDERFKKNIDKYGDGLAEFISRAIAVYCAK